MDFIWMVGSRPLFLLLLFCCFPAFAAISVNLRNESPHKIATLWEAKNLTNQTPVLREISRLTDRNHTLHIRLQETYLGTRVRGGESILHIPKSVKAAPTQSLQALATAKGAWMNGMMFKNLTKDLSNPSNLNTTATKNRIYNIALKNYLKTHVIATPYRIKKKTIELIVYLDNKSQAHWAYQINFAVLSHHLTIKLPILIIDAADAHKIYLQWDNLKTQQTVYSSLMGGGYGGNEGYGLIAYGTPPQNNDVPITHHFPGFPITKKSTLCYLKNTFASVEQYDVATDDYTTVNFRCDKKHPNWDGYSGKINGGFSPNNDAFYAAIQIVKMYKAWYSVAPIPHKTTTCEDNIDTCYPLFLVLQTHAPLEALIGTNANAMWDPESQKMLFGDGDDVTYPLTSLGVAAHEISHGFTEYHSGLEYTGQAGGMNEAFSDMADQAIKFYATKTNDWEVGAEINKENRPFRYLKHPSEDGFSIEHMNDYTWDLDVHQSSGIYNRAFYLLATSPGWDVKRAFDVMVQANRFYWTSTTDFGEGACGILNATRDFARNDARYDEQAVITAFQTVGIEIDEESCHLK